MNANKINWYPGHMKKAFDEIQKRLKDIDFIIEVVDARGIELTSNNELTQIVCNKPIIKIALKKDLSDIKESNNCLVGSIKDKGFRKIVINELDKVFEQKILKAKQKGLVKYEFIGMVVGIPNIGKSSLINFLSSSNSLIVQNKAGVTKKQLMKKINDNYYLIDTPGILFKNIENIEDGYNLAILNCINIDVLPIEDVIKHNYEYLVQHYGKELNKFFELNKVLSFNEFIEFICQKYKYLLKNNEFDYDRAYHFLFNLFSKSLITNFHFR